MPYRRPNNSKTYIKEKIELDVENEQQKICVVQTRIPHGPEC